MPKRTPKSKAEALQGPRDELSEMMYGDRVVRCSPVALLMTPSTPLTLKRDGKDVEVSRTLVGGTIIGDMCGAEEGWQLWECDVIVIPKYKKRDAFFGYRLSDIITTPNYPDPDRWGEILFER